MQNDRFAKFSQRARAVLALAQEEAQAFNHNYIGTEHLLLGLLREREGVAARVLADLGVDLAKATAAFELIVGRGDRAPAGAIGLTPRARKVVQLALEEARNLGHHYIGTEHLLLGLLAEGEGVAAAVLGSMGVRPEDARRRTIARLGGDALADADAEAGRGTPIGPLVSFRPDPDELAAIDRLVADGVRPTREEAIAWLVHLGLEAQRRRGDGGGQAPDEPDGRPEDDPPAAR